MDNRVRHHRVSVAGIDTFREAGRADAPMVLLPHGYPAPPTNFATSCRVLQTAGGCSRRNFQAPATAQLRKMSTTALTARPPGSRSSLTRWKSTGLSSTYTISIPQSEHDWPFDDPNVWWTSSCSEPISTKSLRWL